VKVFKSVIAIRHLAEKQSPANEIATLASLTRDDTMDCAGALVKETGYHRRDGELEELRKK